MKTATHIAVIVLCSLMTAAQASEGPAKVYKESGASIIWTENATARNKMSEIKNSDVLPGCKFMNNKIREDDKVFLGKVIEIQSLVDERGRVDHWAVASVVTGIFNCKCNETISFLVKNGFYEGSDRALLLSESREEWIVPGDYIVALIRKEHLDNIRHGGKLKLMDVMFVKDLPNCTNDTVELYRESNSYLNTDRMQIDLKANIQNMPYSYLTLTRERHSMLIK